MDRPTRLDSNCSRGNLQDHFELRTYYPDLGREIVTKRGVGKRPFARVFAYYWPEEMPSWRKDYDHTRVTNGGLTEAREDICVRVERGEILP